MCEDLYGSEPKRYKVEKTIEFGSPDAKIVTGDIVIYDELAERLKATEAMRAQRAERVVQLDLEMIGLAKQIVSLEERLALAEEVCHALSKTDWADNNTDVSNALWAWRAKCKIGSK